MTSLEERAQAAIDARDRPRADARDEEMAAGWVPKDERRVLAIDTGEPPEAGAEEPAEPEFQFLDLTALSSQTPPPRRWIVTDWLPRGHVTLAVGKGGVGKSLLAQQIGTSIAAGLDWLGVVPHPGAVVGLFCEDDHDELWRRQVDICQAMNVPMAALAARLHYEARAGKHNSLTMNDPKGGVLRAPLYEQVRSLLAQTADLRLLVLDNVAQLFVAGDGGQNDATKVTMFCNLLTAIALEFDIGVLLLAHPAKADGSEWSGSVAWDAAVRSRLLLARENDEPGSRVILSRNKANYASRGGDLPLTWDKGAFLRTDGRQTLNEQIIASSRQGAAEAAALNALAWLTERRLPASHKAKAGNFLPRLMETYGQMDGLRVADVVSAVTRMVGDKRLEVDAPLWKNERRQWVSGLREATVPRMES